MRFPYKNKLLQYLRVENYLYYIDFSNYMHKHRISDSNTAYKEDKIMNFWRKSYGTAYLKLCNLAFDQGRLVTSCAAGVALGDSDRLIFNESMQNTRNYVVYGGMAGGVFGPGLDSLVTGSAVVAKYYNNPNRDTIIHLENDSPVWGLLRNFSAGWTAYQIYLTSKIPSTLAVIGCVMLTGIAVGAELMKRHSKKELETVIEEIEKVV